MPNILYADGNYLIVDTTGVEDLKPKNNWVFVEDDNAFYIAHKPMIDLPLRILKADVGDWENDSAIAYSETTLRAFLTENTGPTPTDGFSFGDCLEFDGVDDYATLPSSLNYATFTVSFWAKFDNVSSQTMMGSSTQTAGFIRVFSSTVFDYRPSAIRYQWVMPTLSTGTWYHFLFASNGTISRLFVNGTESSTGSLATSNGANDFNRISGRGSGDQLFDGLMDDLLITNTYGDPAANASAIYNGGAGADPLVVIPTAQQLYRFNSNTNNSGSLGGSLTLNNFPDTPYTPHV